MMTDGGEYPPYATVLKDQRGHYYSAVMAWSKAYDTYTVSLTHPTGRHTDRRTAMREAAELARIFEMEVRDVN